MFAYDFQIVRKVNRFERLAVVKRAVANFVRTARKGQFLQLFATVKGVFSYRLHVLPHYHALNAAIEKGVCAYFFESVGKGQLALQ